MRHRKKGIKKQHSTIMGLFSFLEEISDWEEITGSIPGRINPIKGKYDGVLQIQYITPTGVKCLWFANSATQEIFLISNMSKQLELRLKEKIK